MILIKIIKIYNKRKWAPYKTLSLALLIPHNIMGHLSSSNNPNNTVYNKRV